MSNNEWVYGSGRSGKPRPKNERGKKVKCPECKQEVQVYGVDIARHKIYVYKNGKKTTRYTWCTRRKL